MAGDAGRRPVLVATGGLVATGKSTLARALADALDGCVVEADATRDRLLQRAEAEGAGPAGGPGTDAVYAEVLERVRLALDAGLTVIVDGCSATRRWRRELRRLAAARGVPFLFVECRADPAVTRTRLKARARERGEPEGDWLALSRAVEERFEGVDELAEPEVLRLDGSLPPAANAGRVLARLDGPERRAHG